MTRQQHLAGRHRAADRLGEVHAQLDRVHIEEDLALTDLVYRSMPKRSTRGAGSWSGGAGSSVKPMCR
jgi:hypothetical protein